MTVKLYAFLYWINRYNGLSDVLKPSFPQYVQREGGGYIKSGKIVTICMSIKIWRDFTAYQTIVDNLPTCLVLNPVLQIRNSSTFTQLTTARMGGKSLYPDSPLTSGETYVISGTYLTSD